MCACRPERRLARATPCLRTDPRLFSSRFGHHRLLAKRVGFGWQRAAESGIDVEESGASVSLAEVVQHTESEHLIVLDEKGKGAAEEALLADLRSDYSPPEVFEVLPRAAHAPRRPCPAPPMPRAAHAPRAVPTLHRARRRARHGPTLPRLVRLAPCCRARLSAASSRLAVATGAWG